MQRLTNIVARAGIGVLIIAVIVVGGLINSYTPDQDVGTRPFSRTGKIGERVDVRTFDVTVLGVRGAPKVSRSDKTYGTGGVWVAVRLRLVARTEAVHLGFAAVTDGRGHEYRASERFIQPLPGRLLQPGIPTEGEVIFEVPKEAVTRLTIELSIHQLSQRMDARGEIPLDIDRAKVDAWLSAQPIEVKNPEVAAG